MLHSLQSIQLPKIQSKNADSISHKDILSYDFSSFGSIDLRFGDIVSSTLKCNNILAFSTKQKEIHLYEPNDNDTSSSSYLVAPIRCKANATILRWKPNSPTFAAAFDNGHISMWSLHYQQRDKSIDGNESTKSFHKNSSKNTGNVAVVSCTYTNSSIHEKRILNFILWNDSGTCLISGDNYGLCCIWKPTMVFNASDDDSVMKLMPLIQIHESNSPLSDAVFIPLYSSSGHDRALVVDAESFHDVSLKLPYIFPNFKI